MASNAELIAQAKVLVDEANTAFTRYNNQATWDGDLDEEMSECVHVAESILINMKELDKADVEPPARMQEMFDRLARWCRWVIRAGAFTR